MTSSEIVTMVIAVYGAVLSTVAIVRQFVINQVKVNVTVQKNMQIVGDPRYAGKTMTLITVTNLGARPVNIKTFGAIGLHPHRNLVALDTNPRTPCELTEGKYVTSFWEQSDLDFSHIDYWAAWDSRGKMHKVKEASWVKHWKSVVQQKRHFRREGKKRALTR
jgi:hypothetical protein